MQSRESRYEDGRIITKGGAPHFLVKDESGIYTSSEIRNGKGERTFSRVKEGECVYKIKDGQVYTCGDVDIELAPKELVIFNTYNEAENFDKEWEGHPWFFKPNGFYKVFKVVEALKLDHCAYIMDKEVIWSQSIDNDIDVKKEVAQQLEKLIKITERNISGHIEDQLILIKLQEALLWLRKDDKNQ
jgi:hypothetical protein